MSKAQINLTKKKVLDIARLANLKLRDKEVSKYQKQLTEILDYMKVLNKAKTKKIKPTAQITGLVNVFRTDKNKKTLSQKQALTEAKNSHKGYFKTKSVF
jgi:aspartyl-tRNA(Asn)/glutamyl-tRNA(Gln) amidotransferase subunit C